MKLSLSTNINKLRKEHGMTQEQLAEALGVTFASVSKWERGATTPELTLIAEMADLFEVSIDALIGYPFRNNDRQNVITRLKRYLHERDNEDVYADIEKSLKRYPNCFEVVYYSARIYQMRGFIRNRREYTERALTLYQQACMLIGQNTDPEISEISIRNDMAATHLGLGEYDKGLEILKQHNPCRLNHPVIGYTLASVCNDPDGALPYLSLALLDLTRTYMQIIMGYVNVYCETGNYPDALAIADWALVFLSGLKNPEKKSYIDKCEATIQGIRAFILLSLGRKEDAKESLHRARTSAMQFDETPSYDAANVCFVSCTEPATAFDDMGDTAMLALDHVIAEFETPELRNLWSAVRNES